MVADPLYPIRRRAILDGLDANPLDSPIDGLIHAFCRLSFCYTIQSCYGHFMFPGQDDPNHIAPLSPADTWHGGRYRIAYIAWCIENSRSGRAFLRRLRQVPEVAPDDVQFGCAAWFWERHPNSYVLQVVPRKNQFKDTCSIDGVEARRLERVRNRFFDHLRRMVAALPPSNAV